MRESHHRQTLLLNGPPGIGKSMSIPRFSGHLR